MHGAALGEIIGRKFFGAEGASTGKIVGGVVGAAVAGAKKLWDMF